MCTYEKIKAPKYENDRITNEPHNEQPQIRTNDLTKIRQNENGKRTKITSVTKDLLSVSCLNPLSARILSRMFTQHPQQKTRTLYLVWILSLSASPVVCSHDIHNKRFAFCILFESPLCSYPQLCVHTTSTTKDLHSVSCLNPLSARILSRMFTQHPQQKTRTLYLVWILSLSASPVVCSHDIHNKRLAPCILNSFFLFVFWIQQNANLML